MTRTEMIIQCGFNKDMTEVVMEGLNKKSTKINQQILDQINQNSFYKVYATDTQFTIHADFHINQYEYKKFASLLKLEYVKAGNLIDQHGLWDKWIEKGVQN
jgi:hypothetical protein